MGTMGIVVWPVVAVDYACADTPMNAISEAAHRALTEMEVKRLGKD